MLLRRWNSITSLFLLLSTTKNPGKKYKTNIRRFWQMAEGPQNSRNSVLCVPRVLLSYVSQTWGWRSQQHGNTNRHRQKSPNKSLLSVAKGPGKGQPSKTETYSQPPLHSSQTPSSGLNGGGPQKDMSTPEPVIVILFGKRVFEDINWGPWDEMILDYLTGS